MKNRLEHWVQEIKLLKEEYSKQFEIMLLEVIRIQDVFPEPR